VTTQQALHLYARVLQEDGIDCELSDDASVLMMLHETSAGNCESYLLADELEATREGSEPITLAFLELFTVLPVSIPPDRLHATLEILLRLNETQRVGAWELLLDEDELRFRAYLPYLPSQDPPRELLLLPLYESLRAVEAHWPIFRLVLEDALDPAHAMAEFYASDLFEPNDDQDDELGGVDEDQLSRTGALLALARDRYRARDDEARALAVTERLDEITRLAGEAVLRTNTALLPSPRKSMN
jgi:hypothetical protein